MAEYYGDLSEDQIVTMTFSTNLKTGGRGDPSSDFEVADFFIMKQTADGTISAKVSTNGLTAVSTYSTNVGLHYLQIDTNNETGESESPFWDTACDYHVGLYPDETVNSENVSAWLGFFSIENRYMRGTDSALLAADISLTAGAVDTVNTVVECTTNTDMLTAAAVNAEVVDALTVDTVAEPTSVPAATAPLSEKIAWVFSMARNKLTQTSTTLTVRNDADGADIGSSTQSDDGTTYTRGEFS